MTSRAVTLGIMLFTAISPVLGSVQARPLDPMLVAWYGFESVQEGKIADLSGHGLDLSVVGTVRLAEGKLGQAVELTGQGYLETSDHPLLAFTDDLTLECWVWLPPEGSGGRLIDKSTPGQNSAYRLDLHPANFLRCAAHTTVVAPAPLAPGQWSHVVATVASYQQTTIYVNGELLAQGPGPWGKVSLTDLPLRLGADSQGGALFRGRLDEVRLYSRALSRTEIAARYAGREVNRSLAPAVDLSRYPVACRDGKLLADYPALVGHNDVVYLTPALYPFEALPLGNGNLGVPLWNQGGMYYKFNNGSFWRFLGQVTAQRSSGEAQLSDIPGFLEDATEFKQRLSLYEGVVYTRATTPQGEVRVTSFVAQDQDLLVVHVDDRRTGPVQRRLTLSHWVEDVRFTGEDGLIAVDSWSGSPDKPPITGLPLPTTSVLAARVEGLPATVEAQKDLTISLDLGTGGPAEYTVYLAAPAVREEQGEPLAYARGMLEAAQRRGWEELLRENKRFWADFWEKSALYLSGEDATAEYFAQLWYLNLYWAGCQSRGPYCPKFDGGQFVLEKDHRSWGGMYWYQNTRQLFWCLPAANHPELVQPLFDFYYSLVPASRQNARSIFKVGGLQIQETSDQNGLGSGAPLKLLILTNGLESAFEFYNWCRYTGNESLLRDKVYPYMREAVQFFLEYAKRGEDGKWHIYPANARETWLKVQDAAPDLYGLRACLPILLRESQRLGRDADLIPVWQEFLDNLADYPTDPDTGAYMPCVFRPDSPETDLPVVDRMYAKPQNVSHDATERKNSEVPECEIMYPWNLAGIDSPNYHQAKLTFTMRKSWPVGWDPSGIWAARLGLADEALRALLIHGGNQRWPQGWWITPGGAYWGKAVPVSPGFDSAGVNATTLTEMCLQSYDGRVRLWPAFPREWSGLLKLRALPGFMVTSEITKGQVRYVVIESERGEECRLINPWEGKLRVTSSEGKSWESGEREVVFGTERGGRYVIEPVEAPLREAVVAELQPTLNQGPRWPGQVSADQAWRKEQPIMVGMAQDGHPLRVRAEAAAAAAAAQQ